MKKKTILFIAAICCFFSLRVISADAADVMDATDDISVESMSLEAINTLNLNQSGDISAIDEDKPEYLDEGVILNTLEYTSEGTYLEWEDFPEQSELDLLGYVIYRYKYDFETTYFDEEGEIFFTEANQTAFLDDTVEPCNIYFYIVAAALGHDDDLTHLSDLGNKSTTCIGYSYTLETPEIALANQASSIKITWNKIPNADGYEIYKHKVNGSWSETPSYTIYDGDTTSFEDKSFEKGTGYYYCVRAFFYDPAGNDYYWADSFSDSIYIKRLSRPTISVENVTTGVEISWGAISGSSGYVVYRDGVELTTTASKTYTDKNVVKGKEYVYTVAAMYKGTDILCYSAESAGKSICFTPSIAPELKVTNIISSIKLSWTKVSGASGYYIYRRTAGKEWSDTPYITITNGSTLSYKDTSYKDGSGYYYKVSYYKIKNGKKIEGDCSEQVYIRRMARPSLRASYDAACIKLRWKAVAGATGYVIYRDGTEIASTKELTYKDYDIVDGVEYTYTAKAYYQGGTKKYYSYSSPKKSIFGIILTIDSPELKVLNSANYIALSWNKIPDADGYCIYRRNSGDDWSTTPYEIITDGDINSFKDKSFKAGKGYYYKITAYLTQSSSRIESEFSNSEYIKRMTRPSVTATNKHSSFSGSYIELSWPKVTGADGYLIYRNNELIATGTDISYEDYNVSNGEKYQYKVRAYYQGGTKKYYSAYSSVLTRYCLRAPSTLTLTAGTRKFTAKVNSNSSSTGIQVRYSLNINMSNSKTYKVKARTATISNLTAKKNYYVQVRYYKIVDGKTYYGAYTLVPQKVTTK